MRLLRLLAMILVLVPGAGNAQSAPAAQDQPSLADAARSARAQQAKSKVVVDNDNLKSQPKSPIPDIDMDSASENSDEVIKAIFDYRAKHTSMRRRTSSTNGTTASTRRWRMPTPRAET